MRLSEIHKPSSEERELFLTDIFQSIQQCSQYLEQLEARYEKLGCQLISPSYFNFRDALFHYEKCYKSQESIQLHCERYAMLEHLHRAMKDGCVKYLQLLNQRLDLLYHYQDSPGRRAQIAAQLPPVLKKVGMTKEQLLDFGFDILALDKALKDVELEKHEFRTLYEVLLVENLCQLPGWRKKLQKVIHQSRNLDLHTRNDSMHIRKPFGTEPGQPAEQAPIDRFLDQCDEILLQLEEDGLFSIVAAATILMEQCQPANGGMLPPVA